MRPEVEASLVMQRENLQKQLQANRKVIASQLGSSPGMGQGFPRSMTMRFLMNNPELLRSVLAEIIKLFVNERLFKLLAALVNLIKSSSANTQKRLPASRP
jgi:hypothetical protein